MKLPRKTGQAVRQQGGPDGFSAFIPAPLPPAPPLEFSPELIRLLGKAALAVGRLDAAGVDIPDARLFLYTYVRKEAVVSSQIEGTQSSLSDLLMHENAAASGVPVDDVIEVSNYVSAMDHGLARLQSGFPLSLRLITEIHGILMRGARGGHASPGEFRRTQNWIGGRMPSNAGFVPPPPHEVVPAMSALEKFLYEDTTTPPLVKAGLAHVQFETIHPFLDGNGRLGRLLITLLLHVDGILTQPLLYLSLYFKTYQLEYYNALSRVRTDGDWEHWMEYYLRGVATVAEDATARARVLRDLFAQDLERIIARGRSDSILRVYDAFKQRALLSVPTAASLTALTPPTIRRVFTLLQDLEIIDEITGKGRDRVYRYKRYSEVLNEDARL